MARETLRPLAGNARPLNGLCKGFELSHKLLKLRYCETLRPVFLGMSGIGVDFNDEGVSASGYRCFGNRRHQVAMSGSL